MRVLLAIVFAAAAPALKHTTADTTTAKASLVTVADMGKGWTGKASPQQGTSFGCTGFHPSGKGIVETGAATSAAITYDTIGPFVLQKASVYATTGQANTYWQRAVTPGLIACVVQTLEAVEARGVKVTITSKGKLPFSTSLPHTAAYRVVGTLDSGKNKVANYFDVIILGKGRTITAITISSFKVAPPASFEKGLATIVASRLAGGAGAA
jgi:hypothetical protein